MLLVGGSQRVRQFLGWFVLGVAAFGAELVLLGALHKGLGYPLWLASAVAAESVLLVRFVTTDRLVFGHARPSFGRCWRFHVASAGSFVVNPSASNPSGQIMPTGVCGLPSPAASGPE